MGWRKAGVLLLQSPTPVSALNMFLGERSRAVSKSFSASGGAILETLVWLRQEISTEFRTGDWGREGGTMTCPSLRGSAAGRGHYQEGRSTSLRVRSHV